MLKKAFVAIVLVVAAFISCNKNENPLSSAACGSRNCDNQFISIVVKYVDGSGQAVIVSDYKVVNSRTKEMVKYAGPVDAATKAGSYVIASDGDLHEFSQSGDDVVVSAKHPVTGEVINAVYKIAGGCQCHVQKISGPDQIQFN